MKKLQFWTCPIHFDIHLSPILNSEPLILIKSWLKSLVASGLDLDQFHSLSMQRFSAGNDYSYEVPWILRNTFSLKHESGALDSN